MTQHCGICDILRHTIIIRDAWLEKREEEDLDLLSGEQHIPPLVDLPDESLRLSHTVVTLPLPLQMFHLQEIQLGSEEGTEPQKHRKENQRREESRGRKNSGWGEKQVVMEVKEKISI